jgi:hypothetical protein
MIYDKKVLIITGVSVLLVFVAISKFANSSKKVNNRDIVNEINSLNGFYNPTEDILLATSSFGTEFLIAWRDALKNGQSTFVFNGRTINSKGGRTV